MRSNLLPDECGEQTGGVLFLSVPLHAVNAALHPIARKGAMKIRVAGLVSLALVACATASPPGDPASVEALIRSRDNQERIAALNRDVAALERLWSEDFIVNAPNNRVVLGKTANLDAFVRSGIIDFSTFDRAIEAVRVDGDFAAIMGLETVVPRSDAPSVGLVAGQPVQRRFTNIWKHERGTWRLYWRHANVIVPPSR